MRQDFKIGLCLGLIIVLCFSVWLATRRDLSIEASFRDSNSNQFQETEVVRDHAEPEVSLPRFKMPLDSGKADNLSQSVEVSRDSEKLSVPASMAEVKPIVHVVEKGQTLSSISMIYYNSPNKWQKILEANSKTLKSADKLKAGTRLIIPQ